MLIPLIIIATILIALFIYYYHYYKVEKFTAATKSVDIIATALNGIISGDIISDHPYIEKLTEITPSSQLKLYLTSFSEKTNYDNTVNVYIPESSRWNNFIKANQAFIVTTTQGTMPPVRPGGMPLNNISLHGIPSDELAVANTQNALSSFSATFFINFTQPAASSNYELPATGFELLKIYLETPNYIRLTLKNVDNDNCKLELEIGNGPGNTLNTGNISKSLLMTNSDVAITITCSISGTNITPIIYIGSISSGTTYSAIGDGNNSGVPGKYTMAQYSVSGGLVLGNSQITINKNRDPLAAKLLAFLYYSRSIIEEEHKTITEYLTKQNTTLPVITSTLDSAVGKLQEIKDYLAANTATQGTLQAQLDACKASIPPVVKAFGHKITMDGVSSVSKEDLRSCSVLEIKDRLRNAIAATPEAETETPGRFQIALPQGLQNVTAIAPL